MTQISFKNYVRLADESLSEEQLDEIFGLFKNNEKVDKLKKEREKLLAAKKAKQDAIDAKWASLKSKNDAENRADQYHKNRGMGSGTARQGQAIDRRGGAYATEGLELNEALRHDRHGLVLAPDHFGSRAEKPEAFRELAYVLKTFNKKVPQDTVYAYDPDGFKDIFTRIMRKLKVSNPDRPELKDALNNGFVKIRRLGDKVFLKKDNIILAISNDDSTAPVVFVDGKELPTA